MAEHLPSDKPPQIGAENTLENSYNAKMADLAGVAEESFREPLHHVMEEVQAELEAKAARLLADERNNHTLEPAALVNEVFLRLYGAKKLEWTDRAHFERIAAKSMRQILRDHGRGKSRQKRCATFLTLADGLLAGPDQPVIEVVAFEELLEELQEFDPRAAEILQLKVFSQMSTPEIARAMGVTHDVARGEWEHARAWLAQRMQRVERE